METRQEQLKNCYEELRQIIKSYDVTILTASQAHSRVTRTPPPKQEIIIIDYIGKMETTHE